MNKNAIKKFAIEARRKLINSVTDKAGMLGITEKSCSDPIAKGADFEVYQTAAGTEVTLNRKQCEKRRKLVSKIESKGFEVVVEEVAYTWFNRICAIRFMEVNDYLPNRVRVLSSEKEGKMEPDLVTLAPDVDLDLTDQEKEEIINWKISGTSEDVNKLYGKLFLKQCYQLHEVLPGLFEDDSDYMELLFGISYTNKDDVIYMLVNPDTGIPEEDFNVSTLDEEGNPTGQVEIIGWLYQYYNTELKDDTFAKLKKNIKISKDRIPAATQLFTPDWIVRYMVENSVGRIWIEHLRAIDPSTDEKETAERFGWKYYLPEAEQEESVNVKLTEIRTTYKDLKPTDITCIDPCMGSGHILIAMFDVLMDIYESAGYDKREAAFEIVEHNIHGLDIDQRAYQLAYFAVMMKGRGYNRRFLRGRDGKPEPKVYAIIESNEINWKHVQFFGTHLSEMERNLAMMQIEGLLDIFRDAREYGSILSVDACDWDVLERFVDDLGTTGQISFESVGSETTQEQLRKLVRVAKNLRQKYDAVVTNPPYMGNRGMTDKLNKYVQNNYSDTKNDMFAVFIERCRSMTSSNSYYAMITQPSFLFLTAYEKLRKKIICEQEMISLLHMGRGIFGIDFGSSAFVIRNAQIGMNVGVYFKLHQRTFQYINPKDIEFLYITAKNNHQFEFDFSSYQSDYALEESDNEVDMEILTQKIYFEFNQNDFNKIPGTPIAYWLSKAFLHDFQEKKLGEVSDIITGMTTGKNSEYLRLWYEVDSTKIVFNGNNIDSIDFSKIKWIPYSKGGNRRNWSGNADYIVNWTRKTEFNRSKTTLKHLYLKKGLTWPFISSGKFSARFLPNGFLWDVAGSPCFFENDQVMYYALGFLCTKIADMALKIMNPTINVQAIDLAKLPFIYDERRKDSIIDKVRENIELSDQDWDSDEVSWNFIRNPLVSIGLHEKGCSSNAIRISESYCIWEEECNRSFYKLKNNEEEINSIFIDIYNLNEEMTSEINDRDVTLRKADIRRDIGNFISYAIGCMFGRYSLDQEGLIYAGGNFDEFYKKVEESLVDTVGEPILDSNGEAIITGEEYGKIKINGEWQDVSFAPDFDNCIPITDEEYFSDDIVTRFVEFVKIVYGADTLEENLDFIANALGNKGDTSREVIRNYFLKDFYVDHLKAYQKRPIYWLFDSGRQNGFKALIYIHRYDADTVGRVRTDYLHRAQKYVETAMQSAQYTIDNASSASEKSKATKAVTKYTKQLAEMKIYDEAIAHIANQRIEIDLDDGVKVNYEKFQGVEVDQEGKKALKVDLLAKLK